MNKTIRYLVSMAWLLCMVVSASAQAAEYLIDTKGAHASINFKIKHLGYSWLTGRFNQFSGRFTYDEKAPAAMQVKVEIDTASIDSNHAERDKHLRGDDFLHVERYPKATFVSTSFQELKDGKMLLKGDLTLHGVTRAVDIDVAHIGHGADPWGGYRRGFSGTAHLVLADFGINYKLGPASREVFLELQIEGVRQQ